MNFLLRQIPEVLAAVIGMASQQYLYNWVLTRPALAPRPGLRTALRPILVAAYGLIVAMVLTRSARVASYLPGRMPMWIGTAGLTWVLLALFGACLIAVFRRFPRIGDDHSAGRRMFLQSAKGAVFAVPVAAAGYAVFIQRGAIGVCEVELPITGLPRELDGLRLAQISDIHLSPFLHERELARAVDLANDFRPHLHLVTGDLISTSGDPLDRCLLQLSRLRSEAGGLGCLGNHEIYAGAEDYVAIHGKRAGIDFLRSEARVLTFRGKSINFVGVDYQRMHQPYLTDTGKLLQPGMTNILLSHNPDVFPVAAAQGFDCTISGHTHGGQITMEILHQNVSVARFFTPFVYGLYRDGKSSVYVTRGIGTVGVPARLGAPPEVALLRLKAV